MGRVRANTPGLNMTDVNRLLEIWLPADGEPYLYIREIVLFTYVASEFADIAFAFIHGLLGIGTNQSRTIQLRGFCI